MTTPPLAPYFPFPITTGTGMATQQFQNYWKTAIDQAVAAALAAQQAQSSANAAQISADGAEAAAVGAQTSANTAITNAAAAQATANTGVTNAATAQATANTNTTNLSAETAARIAADNLLAPLASPALTGNPTAPTQTAGDSSTKLATTAFVTTADNLKAPLASPTLTGTPAAPTPATATNTTQIATTAFVKAQLYIPQVNQKMGSSVGTTDASGRIAITFGMTFSAIPTVIPAPGDAASAISEFYTVLQSTVTTTGFTVQVATSAGALAAGNLRRVNWFASL